MNVACRIHLVLNFEKRLILYLCLKYDQTTKEAWSFINHSFQSNRQMTSDKQEFADWLGYLPSENVIERNFSHFLRKFHDILCFMEAQPPNSLQELLL